MNWTCTDPDSEQFGRQLSENIFEFKEKDRSFDAHGKNKWIKKTINLSLYKYQDIIAMCAPYYKTMDELFDTYGKQSSWIIAECIFEQESGQY